MLGRDRDHDDMIGEKMTFFNPALLLLGQFPEHLAQMSAQIAIKHLPAAFRGKNNVVLALPFRVA
jgi:hypothetical protein